MYGATTVNTIEVHDLGTSEGREINCQFYKYEYPIPNLRLAPVSDTEFILLNGLETPENKRLGRQSIN